jgi:aquaporin Z
VGVAFSAMVLGAAIGHESVNYVATQPGRHGARVAWLAEFLIAFGMMSMVLVSTNHAASAPYTGLFAGAMVAAYITVEAPFSGMSMNPARTLGSALPAGAFRGLWIYFTAPPLAMLGAAVLYTAFAGQSGVFCAKLNHDGDAPCIFNCRIDEMPGWKRRGGSGIQEQGTEQHER